MGQPKFMLASDYSTGIIPSCYKKEVKFKAWVSPN